MRRKDLTGFIFGYGGIFIKAVLGYYLFEIVRCLGSWDGCLPSDFMHNPFLGSIIFTLFAISIIPDIVLIVILTFSIQSPKIYKTAFVLDIIIFLLLLTGIYTIIWG